MSKYSGNFYASNPRVYLTLFTVAFLLFSKSLFYGFSPMDENWLITGNTLFLSDWSNLVNSFKLNLQNIYFRPLLMDTFLINYKLAGLDPFIYHLSNILFHC